MFELGAPLAHHPITPRLLFSFSLHDGSITRQLRSLLCPLQKFDLKELYIAPIPQTKVLAQFWKRSIEDKAADDASNDPRLAELGRTLSNEFAKIREKYS